MMNMNMDDNFDVKPSSSFDGQSPTTASAAGTNNNSNNNNEQTLSSFYPLPPMRYIKQFNDYNVRNHIQPIPPKPFQTPGSYLMFGQNITIDDTIIRSLESQGLRRLYPREYDHKRELKKINASILVNFLDLIDVLIRCPETQKREEKCNDLQLLFITMHHLINELRPHQARESIRVCLKMQKKQREETAQKLLKQIERIQDIIRLAIRNIMDKDINNLLQETLPDNFQILKNNNNNNNNDDDDVIVNTNTNNNTHNNNNNDYEMNDYFYYNDYNDNRNSKNNDHQFEKSKSNQLKNNKQSTTKMAELDAFMCDLIDEQF